MNSEMLGLSYLQIALGKTDHLVAHINSNDKEPSWDGDVEVYRKAGHVHAKADLILKVPVQVKGHCKPNLKKKSIKYSIQYADLKNYLAIGGTIFFVIYINDSGDKAAIYYVDLLPYDLKKHLKAYTETPDATDALPKELPPCLASGGHETSVWMFPGSYHMILDVSFGFITVSEVLHPHKRSYYRRRCTVKASADSIVYCGPGDFQAYSTVVQLLDSTRSDHPHNLLR